MDYMTLKEAAEKWGVTPRRVNYYCAGGRIPGAVKMAGIHFMSNQIGDRLKQLGHQIVTKNTRITEERESTKALVTDISHQLKTPMAALKTCFYIYLDAKESRLCKPCVETPLIRANVQTVCRK